MRPGARSSSFYRRGRITLTATTTPISLTDLEGVVKEVHLVVPHSWVYLEVSDTKGEPQVWALETTSRTGLQNIGVTREYVKPGDKVKVRCHLGADGSVAS